MSGELRAPFPWFGGKRRIAARVWEALGDVRHYVEPFCGSAAVLLARPHAPQTETINDADGMVANFWRAVKAAPAEVAHHADWPVIEVDLHALHKWLIGRRESLTEQLGADPDFFDAKTAGWWVWGACAWIGSGWCREISKQLPHLGNAGVGIHAPRRTGGAFADDDVAFATIGEWIEALSLRLRGVRVATGDFARVLGSGALIADARGPEHRIGVYIDPPYSEGNQQYAAGGTGSELSGRARAWCAEHERDDRLRIVLSGYAGEHDELEARGWSVVAWKTKGGQKRERLWLSPHCEGARQLSLLGGAR